MEFSLRFGVDVEPIRGGYTHATIAEHIDAVVPSSASESMIAAITKAGGTPKFTLYPGVRHDSWTQTYKNPELYRWLFAQRRAGQAGT